MIIFFLHNSIWLFVTHVTTRTGNIRTMKMCERSKVRKIGLILKFNHRNVVAGAKIFAHKCVCVSVRFVGMSEYVLWRNWSGKFKFIQISICDADSKHSHSDNYFSKFCDLVFAVLCTYLFSVFLLAATTDFCLTQSIPCWVCVSQSRTNYYFIDGCKIQSSFRFVFAFYFVVACLHVGWRG